MSIFRKVFANTAVPVAGKVVSVLVSIALIKLLSTNLGVDGFGYYITIFEFVAIFGALSDLGIYATAVREMAASDSAEIPRILGNVIGIRLVSAVATMLLAGAIVAQIPVYEQTPVIIGVWLATSIIIIQSVSDTMKSILQVNYQIRYGTIAAVTGKLARLCWVLFVIILLNPASVEGWGIDSVQEALRGSRSPMHTAIFWVIAGFTFGALVECGITYFYARRLAGISLRFDLDYWKGFLRKALPYAAAVFLGAAYFRADTLLLSLLKGPQDVGIYGVAMRLIENGVFIPVVFVNALLPALAAGLKQNDRAHVDDLLRKSWLFMLSVSAPLVLLAVFFAVPITLLFSSPEYLSGPGILYGSDVAIRISIWALLFSSFNRLLVFTTLALGQQTKILVINAIGLVFNIVTNIVFIPRYGMVAAAVTTVISEALVLVLNFRVVWESLRFRPPVVTSLGVLLVCLGVFGLTALLYRGFWPADSVVGMLLLSAAGSVAYLYVLRATALRHYLGAIAIPGMGRQQQSG